MIFADARNAIVHEGAAPTLSYAEQIRLLRPMMDSRAPAARGDPPRTGTPRLHRPWRAPARRPWAEAHAAFEKRVRQLTAEGGAPVNQDADGPGEPRSPAAQTP
jgi:hypothetical protein